MACNPPADPSVHLLVPALRTPLSVSRANDPVRRHITPRSMHQDDPVPPGAPGVAPPIPVPVDIVNPPAALLLLMTAVGFVDPVVNLIAAQAVMYINEHMSNRGMQHTLATLPSFQTQNLHKVYNRFTQGFVAFCCYCVGRRTWNARVTVACPSVALLAGHNNNALADADRFGRYIEGLYPRLDRNNLWIFLRLQWDNRANTGLRTINLRTFFNTQIRRLKSGGIHSAAWIADRHTRNLRLRPHDTYGLLYQDVLLMGRITDRFDEVLSRGDRWNVTDAQAGEVDNLDISKVYNH